MSARGSKEAVRVTDAPTEVKVRQAMDPVADLLGGSQTIAFRVEFAHLTGMVTAGLLLSQFWYWSNTAKAKAREGWFYLTMDEITQQTGMGREEQETARKRLRELGVLEEERREVKGTLHFRLVKDRLYELLRVVADFLNAGIPQTGKVVNQNAGLSHSRLRDLRNLVRGIVTNQTAGIPHSLLLENTSGESLENTLETRADAPECPPINPPRGKDAEKPITLMQLLGKGVKKPDADTALENVWSSVLSLMKEKVNKPTYEGHIRLLKLVAIEDRVPSGCDHAEGIDRPKTAVLQVPSEFTRTWIEKRHTEDLQAAFQQAGYGVELRFVVGGN